MSIPPLIITTETPMETQMIVVFEFRKLEMKEVLSEFTVTNEFKTNRTNNKNRAGKAVHPNIFNIFLLKFIIDLPSSSILCNATIYRNIDKIEPSILPFEYY